jgi:antitoxin (DNA-binding transcriptional repressor) of toxin-antitoxin stability system
MTNRVSSFNAKTHFSNLLSQVQNGNEFIITKHNHVIAKLIPVIDENENVRIFDIIEQIKINRKNYSLKLKQGIQKLRTEGRR